MNVGGSLTYTILSAYTLHSAYRCFSYALMEEQWPREVDVLVKGHNERVRWDWVESGLGDLCGRESAGRWPPSQAGKNFPSAGNIGSLTPGTVSISLCTDQKSSELFRGQVH